MNPLDRIAQLSEENRQLRRSVDELRAQNETARQELAREAGTIAKLAKDKRELFAALEKIEDFSGRHHHCTIADLGGIATKAILTSHHA